MVQILKPCRGRITQWFANLQSHDGRKHTGNDYGYYTDGAVTDEVFAAADGVVQFAGDSRSLGWPNRWYINPDFDRSDAQDSSAGNFIAITHTQGGVRFDTTYSHLAAWTVRAGDAVKAGQRIGTVGATGFSAGKHLHFELLFHPFNFGTDTYGRADPNPHIITGGIAAQGATQTAEEDDDMFTQAEKDALFGALARIDQKASTLPGPTYWVDMINAQARIDAFAAAGTDPAKIAAAIADALPAVDAAAVVDALAKRLAG